MSKNVREPDAILYLPSTTPSNPHRCPYNAISTVKGRVGIPNMLFLQIQPKINGFVAISS